MDRNQDNLSATGESFRMKLYVIGETSGDPRDWFFSAGTSLVIAECPEQAAKLADTTIDAIEVKMDNAVVLFSR